MTKKTTVYVRLSGGLGNQLFQLVTAYIFSQKSGLALAYYVADDDFYERDFLLIGLASAFGAINRKPDNQKRSLTVNDLTFYSHEILCCYNFDQDIIMHGSFQNTAYISPFLNTLRPIILSWLSSSVNLQNLGKYKNTLHLRLAHNMSKNLNAVNKSTPLPSEFVSSLVKASGINPSSEINLISDLPSTHPAYLSYVRKLSKYLPDHILKPSIFVRTPLEDLYLLATTSELLYLSNSTFSLWASFLNSQATIYAPYLGNIEKWASNISTTNELYFNWNSKSQFHNHFNSNMSHLTKPHSILVKFILITLHQISLLVPLARILKHKLERYYSKRYF